MTKTEKVVLTVMVVIIALAAIVLFIIVSAVQDAGGFGQLIVEAGKQVKDIAEEIQDH